MDQTVQGLSMDLGDETTFDLDMSILDTSDINELFHSSDMQIDWIADIPSSDLGPSTVSIDLCPEPS